MNWLKLAIGAATIGGGYYAWKKFEEETWPKPCGTIVIGGDEYTPSTQDTEAATEEADSKQSHQD